MSIYSKLALVQSQLKAPKNKQNTFSNFNYRSLEDICEAVKPLLIGNGLTMFIKDEIELIGDRYYIKSTATLAEIESGEKIEVSAYARETQSKPKFDESQITGSASSYARKYALNGLFLIDDTKDADTDEYAKLGQDQDEASKKLKPTVDVFAEGKKLGFTSDEVQFICKQKFKVPVEVAKDEVLKDLIKYLKTDPKKLKAWVESKKVKE